MWDNRVGKRNPKAPDFKCKDRGCDGVIWPPRGVASAAAPETGASMSAGSGDAAPARASAAPAPSGRAVPAGMPACPICAGPMWDDRTSKRNPRAPDFKCRNKPKERGGPGCEGVIWPPRDGSPSPYPASPPRRSSNGEGGPASRRCVCPLGSAADRRRAAARRRRPPLLALPARFPAQSTRRCGWPGVRVRRICRTFVPGRCRWRARRTRRGPAGRGECR